MNEIKLGSWNELRVKEPARREGYGAVFGLYLEGGSAGDILMPQKYVPVGAKKGDMVRCFVYLDGEERLVATTETPVATVGECAFLECTWVNQYGAFLDWGITKNLFCPFKEQKRRMIVGQYYPIHIHIDPESYRLVASAKIDRYLEPLPDTYAAGQAVNLFVWQKTGIGFRVVVDGKYAGMLYENQVFRPIRTGDKLQGYISKVRPDGKADCSLQAPGYAEAEDFADKLLHWLEQHDGYCPLGDKSDAEDIRRTFGVSKKIFKKAVGALYRRRIIRMEGDGLVLIALD